MHIYFIFVMKTLLNKIYINSRASDIGNALEVSSLPLDLSFRFSFCITSLWTSGETTVCGPD